MEAAITINRFDFEVEWDDKIDMESEEFSVFQTHLLADYGYSRTRKSDEFKVVYFSSPEQRSLLISEKTLRLSGEAADTVTGIIDKIESQCLAFSQHLIQGQKIKAKMQLILRIDLPEILHPIKACHIPLANLEKLKIGRVSFGLIFAFEKKRPKSNEPTNRWVTVIPEGVDDEESKDEDKRSIIVQYNDYYQSDIKNLSAYLKGINEFICEDIIKVLVIVLGKEGQA